MLIIHASPDHNINSFISLVRESNCDFICNSFFDWQNSNKSPAPQGFVYIRVAPEITHKKLLKQNAFLSLAELHDINEKNENYFVEKTTMPAELKNIPILLLNGNINFEDDFSQFYTHLFSIKKFFKGIKDQEDKKNGIYIEPKKKHRSCKC